MKVTKIKPFIGQSRTLTFFAWLPVTVRGANFIETRWLERVTVMQQYTAGPGGDWWNPVRFIDQDPLEATLRGLVETTK